MSQSDKVLIELNELSNVSSAETKAKNFELSSEVGFTDT
jgi:hypothetical protein